MPLASEFAPSDGALWADARRAPRSIWDSLAMVAETHGCAVNTWALIVEPDDEGIEDHLRALGLAPDARVLPDGTLLKVNDSDGSFVVAAAEAKCAKMNAKSGAEFGFWHPPLVTLHMWIWYPNPGGIFGEFNPLLTPFNKD